MQGEGHSELRRTSTGQSGRGVEESPGSGLGPDQHETHPPDSCRALSGCICLLASGPSRGSGDPRAHCHRCVPGHVHPAGGPGSRKCGQAPPVPLIPPLPIQMLAEFHRSLGTSPGMRELRSGGVSKHLE